MKAYGAKVILITKQEGGFIRCVQEAKEQKNSIKWKEQTNCRS